MDKIYPGWTVEQLEQVNSLQSNAEMLAFAIAMLKTMPQPICQVCGPITTGGRGSFEENLKVLNHAICFLRARGMSVFDRQPYQKTMQRLKAITPGYHAAVLEEFYLPIFKTGLITRFYFVPGWRSSAGAHWERDRAIELDIAVRYLAINP